MTKGTPRWRLGIRSWAALLPLLAHLEDVGLRCEPCETHYRTQSNFPCGRYKPRYGPGWWW